LLCRGFLKSLFGEFFRSLHGGSATRLFGTSGWSKSLNYASCGRLGRYGTGSWLRNLSLDHFDLRRQWLFGLGRFRFFHNRNFFDRTRRLLDNLDGALDCHFLLGEVLVANLLRQLFRHGVRRNAHIYTFASNLFDESLGVELKFFGQVVDTNL
jgi:hypothetical protein